MNINPYELLGLSSNSTLKELKKSYYEFSLLCHPDRGGNCEEMDIIHNSYKYIKNQLENCNKEDTYEQLEKNFENFCNEQEEKTPCFLAIYEETNDFIREFNKNFEDSHIETPFTKGYGDLMEKTELQESYDENNATDFYKPLENNFKQEITIYKEPFSIPDTYGEQFHLNAKEVKDFTHNGDNLQMSDYQIAFNDIGNLEDLIDNSRMSKTLEELVEERNNEINSIQKENNNAIENQKCLINDLYNKKNNSATNIQKIFRGFKYRQYLKREHFYKQTNKYEIYEKSALLIQKYIRGRGCRKNLLKEKQEKKKKEIEKENQDIKNKKREMYNFL